MVKGRNPEEWITVKQAAELLSTNNGREIKPDYVRRLGANGTFETWQVDARTKLYNKSQIDHYLVKPRGDGSIRRAVRKDAREKAAQLQKRSNE